VCNADGVALLGHDFEPFCELSVNLLDGHWVVVVAREDMAINV
jgi:hypothetical protein